MSEVLSIGQSYATRVTGGSERERVTLPRGTVLEPQTYWQGKDADWAARVNDDAFPAAVLGVSVLLAPAEGWYCGAGWAVVDVAHGHGTNARRGQYRSSHRYIAHTPNAQPDCWHAWPHIS